MKITTRKLFIKKGFNTNNGKKNIIDKNKGKILTNSQKIIFKEKDILMQTTLIELNKNTSKILKSNLFLKEKKKNFERKT